MNLSTRHTSANAMTSWNTAYNMTQSLSAQPVRMGIYSVPCGGTYARVMNQKQYELKDHLGNVRVTFSDRKEPQDCDNLADGWVAVAISVNNYYSFGMLQPGRNWNAENYRFGFNGQENDNEISGQTGSHTTAEYWEYDSRLGRRWNLDPVKLASISPYACLYNNPVYFIDGPGNSPEPPYRTKALNIFVIPNFSLIRQDIRINRIGSAYLWDFLYAVSKKLFSFGRVRIVMANDIESMVGLLMKKCGKRGYIDNLVIDFHSYHIGNEEFSVFSTSESSEGYSKQLDLLSSLKDFFGSNAVVLLGNCWAGYDAIDEPNPIPENSPADILSDCWPGTVVLGSQSYSSSISLLLFNHFVGAVFENWAYDAPGELSRWGVYTLARNGKTSTVKVVPTINNYGKIKLMREFKVSKLYKTIYKMAMKHYFRKAAKRESNDNNKRKKRDRSKPLID